MFTIAQRDLCKTLFLCSGESSITVYDTRYFTPSEAVVVNSIDCPPPPRFSALGAELAKSNSAPNTFPPPELPSKFKIDNWKLSLSTVEKVSPVPVVIVTLLLDTEITFCLLIVILSGV